MFKKFSKKKQATTSYASKPSTTSSPSLFTKTKSIITKIKDKKKVKSRGSLMGGGR